MSAIISACGAYRYTLSRQGDMTATRGPALFIMLNPSTADADLDDPTIRRCRSFAQTWGCNGIQVVNLYALRSTNPEALWDHPDPVGPENDQWLVRMANEAEEIVCAWGANAPAARVRDVVRMLLYGGARLKCFGTTKHGAPRHPLYVRGDQPLLDWAASTAAPEDMSLQHCAAARDGDCSHAQCPQLRDNEPTKSGRHCPLDNHKEDD